MLDLKFIHLKSLLLGEDSTHPYKEPNALIELLKAWHNGICPQLEFTDEKDSSQ